MAISINWATKVITVPQNFCTNISGSLYEFDVDAFRLALKDIEDSVEGMAYPDTHRHNTTVTLSGVPYARTFEIINGYTVTFEPTGTPWTASCTNANHNIADVKNVNHVSLIVNNSAGLVEVGGADPWATVLEGTLTAKDMMRIMMAVLQGDATGLDGTTPAFKSVDGSKTRVAATISGGSRTVGTRDAT